MINPENLLVDGKKIGDVLEFQITYTAEDKKASIKYAINGVERLLLCETEAISFE